MFLVLCLVVVFAVELGSRGGIAGATRGVARERWGGVKVSARGMGGGAYLFLPW